MEVIERSIIAEFTDLYGSRDRLSGQATYDGELYHFAGKADHISNYRFLSALHMLGGNISGIITIAEDDKSGGIIDVSVFHMETGVRETVADPVGTVNMMACMLRKIRWDAEELNSKRFAT